MNRSRDDEYNSVDEEEEDDDIEGEGSNDSMSLKAELSKVCYWGRGVFRNVELNVAYSKSF